MKSKGFTLIELMIVLFVIAMATALILPVILRKQPGRERDQFITDAQALVSLAWRQALTSGKLYGVFFNLQERTAYVGPVEKKDGKITIGKLKGLALPTSMQWPKDIEIKKFVIDGADQMALFGHGKRVTEVYFVITPDGIAQQVVLGVVDKSAGRGYKPTMFDLELSPFSAQFKVVYA